MHFAVEEALFSVLDYPEAAAHKMAHDKLVEKLVEFMKNFEKNNQ